MTQPIVYLHEKVVLALALCNRLPSIFTATKTDGPVLSSGSLLLLSRTSIHAQNKSAHARVQQSFFTHIEKTTVVTKVVSVQF